MQTKATWYIQESSKPSIDKKIDRLWYQHDIRLVVQILQQGVGLQYYEQKPIIIH